MTLWCGGHEGLSARRSVKDALTASGSKIRTELLEPWIDLRFLEDFVPLKRKVVSSGSIIWASSSQIQPYPDHVDPVQKNIKRGAPMEGPDWRGPTGFCKSAAWRILLFSSKVYASFFIIQKLLHSRRLKCSVNFERGFCDHSAVFASRRIIIPAFVKQRRNTFGNSIILDERKLSFLG